MKKNRQGGSNEKYAGGFRGKKYKGGISNGIVLDMSHRAIPFEILVGVRW